MEKSNVLEKMKSGILLGLFLLGSMFLSGCKDKAGEEPLRLAISPYQDLAMITNIQHLGLEKKYGTNVELVTLPWEEIISAVGSSGKTVDVGFASYIEYITKSQNLNSNTTDSILFIYPAYVFAGGGFTTYKKKFPVFTKETVRDTALIRKFLSFKIGAQKNSMFDMAVYQLANYANVNIDQVKLLDVPMADGILALQSGGLDFASAGLTQRNEVEKQGGKVALSFNTLGFADITGFICKKSVFEKRRKEIEALIKMWFDCVDFVMQDVDKHVTIATLPYLDKNASTKYTIETYKTAISQEIFPRSIQEARATIIADTAGFNAVSIYQTLADYLVKNGKVKIRPARPQFIDIY